MLESEQPLQRRLPFRPAIIITACLGLALIAAVQWTAYLNHDAAWFTWGAMRMLQGAVLGRDLLEPNFPLAYLIYVPAALFGQVLGLSAGLKLWMMILAAVSLVMALSRIDPNAQLPFSVAFVLFLAFAVPQDFGQREQIALLLVLPYCLPLPQPGRRQVFVGVMAGIGFAIKPHFMLAWGLVELGRKPFRIEQLALVATASAYLASIFLFFPTFVFEMLPVTRQVYGAFNRPGAILSVASASILFIVLFLASRTFGNRVAQFISVSAAGFIIAAFAQQRLYSYQLLPAWGLLSLGTAVLIASQKPLAKWAATFILAGVVLRVGPAASAWWHDDEQRHSSIPLLIAVLDEHQDFAVLGVHPYPAFPTAIYTRARYLGLSNSHWFLPAVAQSDGANQAAVKFAIRQTVVELSREPHIIIVDRNWRRHTANSPNWDGLQWLIGQPHISPLWRPYRRCAKIGQFDVYVRGQSSGQKVAALHTCGSAPRI